MSTETENEDLPVENVVVVKKGLDAKKEVFPYSLSFFYNVRDGEKLFRLHP
ncbi:MAG: hypothetical protein U9N47_11975 [Thermodesulfobacteriota bacterium]|nr:hypothetical protein [Thermodesulfobacteriota bacterium]